MQKKVRSMFTQTLSESEIAEIWKASQAELQTQLTPAVFNTWIVSNPLTSLEFDSQNQALATITCPTAFHATNLKKNLYTQIKESLERQLNKTVEITFVVGTPHSGIQTEAQKQKEAHPEKNSSNLLSYSTNSSSPTVDELFSAHTLQASFQDRAKTASKRIGLRLDYTFKTFAVSTTNEMSHAAATAMEALELEKLT